MFRFWSFSKNPIIPAFICSLVLFSIFEVWYLNSRSNDLGEQVISLESKIFQENSSYKNMKSYFYENYPADSLFNELLKGGWSFVFVGYTSCPDVCPTTLNVISHAFDSIKKMKNIDDSYRAMFISIDFKDDKLSNVQSYAKNFHKKIKGFSKPQSEVDGFLKWIGASYSQLEGNVSHSTSIYLVNPYGQLVGEFVNPIDPKAIAGKFSELYHSNSPPLRAKNFTFTKVRQGSTVVGGSIELTNDSDKDVVIKDVLCSEAERVEVHSMKKDFQSKTMKMLRLESLTTAKKSSVDLKKDGKHLMIYLNPKNDELLSLKCLLVFSDQRVMVVHGQVEGDA